MYAYVTCCLDIGYHVTMLSKFCTAPAAIHYTMLKHVAQCLCRTRSRGLIYHQPTTDPLFPCSSTQLIARPSGLPEFSIPDKPGQLIGFVDAPNTNHLCCPSTTAYAFLLNFGIISYCAKTTSQIPIGQTFQEHLKSLCF